MGGGTGRRSQPHAARVAVQGGHRVQASRAGREPAPAAPGADGDIGFTNTSPPPPQVMAAPPVAPREGTPAQHRHLEPKGRLLREQSLSDAAMDLTGHSPHFPCRRKRGFREALGGWDPALPCAPFRGIERTLLWPGRGPAAVGALRLGALSTAPCLPGTWGPGSQRFPRGPGSLVSSAGTAAATCPLLPVRTQTGPWVLAGWAGTGGTRPVLPRPAVELDCAPTAPPPAPHARGTAPGRRD